MRAGLENHATTQALDNGRRSWPTNPFDVVKVEGFAGVNVEPWDLSDGQWSYITQNSGYNEFRNMEEVEGMDTIVAETTQYINGSTPTKIEVTTKLMILEKLVVVNFITKKKQSSILLKISSN